MPLDSAFRHWFSNSTVLNAVGDPLIMYHGTNAVFDTFKRIGKRRGGFYFHTDPNLAMQYGVNLKAVYLKAENPFDYENPEHMTVLLNAVRASRGFEDWMIAEARLGDWEMLEMKTVQEAIKERGHDSYFVNDRPGKALAVYEPTQIRLVPDTLLEPSCSRRIRP